MLPDHVKHKAAQPAADTWRSATVSRKGDRKDKALNPLNLNDLYAIVPGPNPALSAARLVRFTSTPPSMGTAPGLGALQG